MQNLDLFPIVAVARKIAEATLTARSERERSGFRLARWAAFHATLATCPAIRRGHLERAHFHIKQILGERQAA